MQHILSAETDQPQLIDLSNLFEIHQLKAMIKAPACFSIKIKEVRMSLLLSSLTKLTNFDVRGYSLTTPAKSGVGFSILNVKTAHSRASGFFMCHALSYLFNGGLAVESRDSPVSVLAGMLTPSVHHPMISIKSGEIAKSKRGH